MEITFNFVYIICYIVYILYCFQKKLKYMARATLMAKFLELL